MNAAGKIDCDICGKIREKAGNCIECGACCCEECLPLGVQTRCVTCEEAQS